MINKIVNNSLSSVQLSTSKVDNSQDASFGFQILMNLAGNRTDTTIYKGDANGASDELDTAEDTETGSNQDNPLVSILLLNNNFMQLFNNNLAVNGQISDETINSMISSSNLSGFSLEDIKQAMDCIKSKLSGQQVESSDNAFTMMQKIFDSKNENQTMATLTSKINNSQSVQASKSDSNQEVVSITTNNSQATAVENTNQAIIGKIQSDILDLSTNVINNNITEPAGAKVSMESTTVQNSSSNNTANSNIINSQNSTESTEQLKANTATAAETSNAVLLNTNQSAKNNQATNSQTKVSAEQKESSQAASIQDSANSAQSTLDNTASGNQTSNSGNNNEQKKQAQNFEKQVQEYAINSNSSVKNTDTETARVSMINENYDEQGRVNVNDIPRYVNKLIQDMPSNSTQQAKLYLEPANLGKLTINITLTGNTATISFKADSKEAVQSIENQLSALKDKLSSNGIKIESAEVEQQTTNSNADTNGNRSNEGGSSQKEESGIKKEYLNTIRGVALDNLTNDELPAQANTKLNNGSLERYI
jgi:flagellar hook-length control protein FliK